MPRLIQFRPPDKLAVRLDRYVRSERPPSANKAVIALVESALSQWERRGISYSPPSDQLDLATIVVRLEQIRDEGYENGHWLLDRVIHCDLPRLRQMLDPSTLKTVTEIGESL